MNFISELDFDVIIPTWNSEKNLERALQTTREFLRPNRIILVDRYSTDKTLEIAKKYNCDIIFDDVSLGSARMKGIAESKAKWVCFIDDDIGLSEGIREAFVKQIRPEIGAIQSMVIDTHYPYDIMTAETLKTRLKGRDFYVLQKGKRGFTNATLIDKDALKGLDIADINSWEDWAITKKVTDNGYKWIIIDSYAKHYHTYEKLHKQAGRNASGVLSMAKGGYMPVMDAFKWYIDYEMAFLVNSFKLQAKYRDPKLFILNMKCLFEVVFSPQYVLKASRLKPSNR